MNSDSISIANRMLPGSVDMLILLGAIALVALVVFLCVLVFRKDEKHQHKHHRRKNYREQLKNTNSGIKELIHRNRRQHQREHRPINPTLAQTGGLPPIREDDKSPPSSSQP